ncbi:hypothetical protein KO516_08450 [Citreicella sp. C3M06]|uniref:hypothetical protein n=1 Tax=Citreicella sp. C3M06 TaxID=2841564 RepID=UPI001C090BEF|nr:hypothetical protein [Citreicella sp. C3M06]MBU2960842.1 hypothetical protein [Citreicella sp. C3M06]
MRHLGLTIQLVGAVKGAQPEIFAQEGVIMLWSVGGLFGKAADVCDEQLALQGGLDDRWRDVIVDLARII